MKAKSFACGWPRLAAARDYLAHVVSFARNLNPQRYPVLGLAGLALLSPGCATHHGAVSKSSGVSEEAGVSRFGTVAFAEQSSPPANFSFQKAKGKLGSAKQAILDSAELGLSAPGAGVIVTRMMLDAGSPGAGDPIGEVAVAGAVGTVTVVGAALAGPVVGAEGLIRSLRSVSPAELAEREAALTSALSQMAAQQPFRRALLQIGAEKIQGGWISPDPENSVENTATNTADVILDAGVDDLRLQRAGSSEGSYSLSIKTHARLVRRVDGVVCFDQRAEYRSGRALFLDWTMEGAIQGVAETGYQALARYYVDQLLFGAADSHASLNRAAGVHTK